MRAVKTTIFAALAVALAAAPASANPHWQHHHHDGFWGGPGLVFGLVGAAMATGFAVDAYCVRYEPTYDAWGNYIGRRPINMC